MNKRLFPIEVKTFESWVLPIIEKAIYGKEDHL